MKAYGGVDVQIQIFLSLALIGECQLHAPAALPRGKKPRFALDRMLGLDTVEKRKFLTQPGLELQPVASGYTDYAIPVSIVYIVIFFFVIICLY
jgi:hypothetical protein